MGKRLFVMALLMLVVIGVAAQTVLGVAQAGVVLPKLAEIMAPLIVAMVTPLFVRLFRKLGVEIEESVIEPIIMQIIELIASVEANKQGLDGAQKKAMVTALVEQRLARRDQALLVRRYGSLETAVQAAFERSSTAKKSAVRAVVK